LETYRFEDAPRLSRRRAAILAELVSLLPGGEEAALLRRKLEGSLPCPESGAGVVVRSACFADEAGPFPAAGVRVRLSFSLGGSGARAHLEVPLEDARRTVARTTGIASDVLASSDLLSGLEEGVIAFHAERAAAALSEEPGILSAYLPFSLTRVECDGGDPEWGEHGPAGWYSLAGSADGEKGPVAFRLLLPLALLAEERRRREIGGEEGAGRARIARLLDRMGDVPVSLTACLGEIHLSAGDLSRVERNDIILFESTEIAFDEGKIGGRIHVTLEESPGAGPVIIAEVVSDEERLIVKVLETTPGGAPPGGTEGARVDQDAKEEREEEKEQVSREQGDDAGEAAAAPKGETPVDDVPVVLRAELGRVRMSLRDLSKLSPGAVLELRKDPAGPVELVVEDRVLGLGEVVRVEGELGVRILSLQS